MSNGLSKHLPADEAAGTMVAGHQRALPTAAACGTFSVRHREIVIASIGWSLVQPSGHHVRSSGRIGCLHVGQP
eukprot:361274-Chlamydomonas_euryale.AAC.6